MFSKATSIVHHWLESHVSPGDLVVDATSGNGHDTLKLAHLVGPDGRVVAVDIQDEAIQATRDRLIEADMLDRVDVHCMSHEALNELLDASGVVSCAVFNLGYLPGGDKALVTTPMSTLRAHQVLLDHLAPGGVIFSTVYTGHEGGKAEAAELEEWARSLDGKRVTVARHEWVNLDGQPPYILVIHKRA